MQDLATTKPSESGKNKKKVFELEDKWSKIVVEQGWSGIPSVLLKSQKRLGLSNNHLVILIHLIDHWFGKDQKIFPSMGTLADRMDLSKGYVRSKVAELENLGFLRREKRFKQGQQSNFYYLDGLVEKLIPHAEAHKGLNEAKKELEKRKQPKV